MLSPTLRARWWPLPDDFQHLDSGGLRSSTSGWRGLPPGTGRQRHAPQLRGLSTTAFTGCTANALGSRCCEVRVTTVRNRHIDAPDRTEEPTACGHLKGTDERAFLAKDEYRCRARFDEQGRIHDTAVDEDFVSRVVREGHRQRRRGSERCVDAGEGHEQSDEHSSRTCEARPAMR